MFFRVVISHKQNITNKYAHKQNYMGIYKTHCPPYVSTNVYYYTVGACREEAFFSRPLTLHAVHLSYACWYVGTYDNSHTQMQCTLLYP